MFGESIADYPEMMTLFDTDKNDALPQTVNAKEAIKKYWFTIEGKSVQLIPRTVYRHLQSGAEWRTGSLEGTKEDCMDGFGQEEYYPTQGEFAKKMGMSQQTVSRLVRSGFSYADIEQGLHLPVVDHLGKRYKSKTAMAQAYGLTKFVFDKREKAGWTLDRILTTPINHSKCPIGKR